MKHASHLSIAEEELAIITLTLHGNLLSTNARSVRAELVKALSVPHAAAGALALFSLDLTAAQKIDSVGLNLLVWLLKAVRERGGRLRLLVSNPHLQKTLGFTRLDQQAEVVLELP